jgi:hypothetical protein
MNKETIKLHEQAYFLSAGRIKNVFHIEDKLRSIQKFLQKGYVRLV